jgi:ABC-2 type transport system permease protein
MNMLLGQIKLETKLLMRDKAGLFWILVFPVFFIVLFGLIYRGTETWDNITPIQYIMPGIIVMAVMTTCIIATVTNFVEEREKGIYRRLSLTPLKRHTLIGGQIGNRYVVVLVQTIILIAVGVGVFGAKVEGNYLLFWGVLTLGALSFLAIGFALTGVIRTSKSAISVSMIPFFILMFLGGIFFPVDVMPGFLHPVSEALPSTHLNDALRMVAVEQAGVWEVLRELPVMLGWLVGCLALAVRFFRWD